MSIRTLCSAVLIIFLGATAAYTVDGHTYSGCEVKAVIGIPVDAAPKTVVTSCGAFFTGPHAKKGLTNINNIADMNRAAEQNEHVKIHSTGWPIPVAHTISGT